MLFVVIFLRVSLEMSRSHSCKCINGLQRTCETHVVLSDPPSVTPIPEEGLLEVQLGEEVVMGCSASGVPHPIVTWSNEVE